MGWYASLLLVVARIELNSEAVANLKDSKDYVFNLSIYLDSIRLLCFRLFIRTNLHQISVFSLPYHLDILESELKL